jgi:O-6-methylguanine DNA methyltransferase
MRCFKKTKKTGKPVELFPTEFASLEVRHKAPLLTGFTARVYQVVAGIPLGQVRSYRWVAQQAGSPDACRAVGQILKRNPYPLIIPCHRVIHSDQKPGGYVFGRQRKISLLALEKEIARCMFSKK